MYLWNDIKIRYFPGFFGFPTIAPVFIGIHDVLSCCLCMHSFDLTNNKDYSACPFLVCFMATNIELYY